MGSLNDIYNRVQQSAVDPNVIDPATGLPAGLIYDQDNNQWTDAAGNLWMPQQMDPNAPAVWTNQTEMAASGQYPNDATAAAAQKLGIKDFNGFAARANSGNLTQDDIQKIGQLSSVAPQMDASGKVTNASEFFSGAVSKAQDTANASNKGSFLGIPMDPGVADALTLGSAYLGGGNALASGTGATATGATAGDIAAGSAGMTNLPLAAAPAATSDAALSSALAGFAPAASAWPSAPTISQGVSVAGPTETAAGQFGTQVGTTAMPAEISATPQTFTATNGVLSAGSGLPGLTEALITGAAGTAAQAVNPASDPNTNINTGPADTTQGQTSDPNSPGIQNDGVTPVTTPTSGSSGSGTSNALSRIMDGTASTADWLSVIGGGAATGLGIYGANEQANKLKEIADRYYATGAPSRERYEASFAPGFKATDMPGYQDALDTSTDTLLRRASTGGNPVGNPGVMAEIAKYVTGNVALPALQNYRTQNANTGGYSSFNTAAPRRPRSGRRRQQRLQRHRQRHRRRDESAHDARRPRALAQHGRAHLMPTLESVLAGIPGAAGFYAKRQMNEQGDASQIQQASTLLGLQRAIQQQRISQQEAGRNEALRAEIEALPPEKRTKENVLPLLLKHGNVKELVPLLKGKDEGGFTLNEGQQRFDSEGNPIASAGAKATKPIVEHNFPVSATMVQRISAWITAHLEAESR
jgi:hypothetical protein